VITYNSDTIFESKYVHSNQDYYDLAYTDVLIVNIRAKLN
jgi:hypothetical protein